MFCRLGFLLGASQQAFLQKYSIKWIPGIVKIGCFQGKRRAVLGLVLCKPDCLPGASLLSQLLKLSYKIKLHKQGVSPQDITQEKIMPFYIYKLSTQFFLDISCAD